MAQLELASLAPVTAGPAAKIIGMGAPVEAGAGVLPSSFSFRLLLQGDLPENLVATTFGQSAMVKIGSSAPDPQAGQPGLEMVDPADPGEAGEQLVVSALAEGLASDAGEDDLGELADVATDTGAGDADIGAAESPLVRGDWLGLPLVMDARAALRNAGSPDAATPASTVSADARRLRLLSCSAAATGQRAMNGDGPAPQAADPVVQTLGDATLASTATEVATDIESPRPAPDPAGKTAGADLPEAFHGSPASMAETLKGERARPVDPSRSTGTVSGPLAGIESEEVATVGPASAPVRLPDAPHPAPAVRVESAPASAAPPQAKGDRQPASPTSAHPLQWHPRLAESLTRIGAERSASAGNAETGDETPSATTAAKGNGDAVRPLPSAVQDLSSFLAANAASGRSADAVASLAPARPDEVARELAAIRVAEPADPVDVGALARSGTSSAAPIRPDAPTSSTTLPTAPDVLNLNQKNWERTLGHQLSWMVNNRLQEAEIKVNPPDLGPLEVRVSQHQHQTSVTFFSHEAAVREALENALPRLREMLDSQGISLNQAQVSDQSLARQQAGAGEQQSAYGRRDGGSPTGGAAGSEAADGEESPRPRARESRGAVDDYA